MNRFLSIYDLFNCIVVAVAHCFYTFYYLFIWDENVWMELDINNRYISKAEREDFVASPFLQIQLLFSVAKLATFIFSERVQLLAATGLLHKPNYIHSIASLIPLLKP